MWWSYLYPLFTEQPGEVKRLKVETEAAPASSEVLPSLITISDALAKFLDTSEKNMLQSEALKGVWEYIKANNLEVFCLPLHSTTSLAFFFILFGLETLFFAGSLTRLCSQSDQDLFSSLQNNNSRFSLWF